MKKIQILVIEDNRILRESIVAMINAQHDLKVVGASDASEKAITKSRMIRPEVILINLGLKSTSGLQIAQLLMNTDDSKVIGMDLVPAEINIGHFIEAGVSGFVLADSSTDDFLGTIRSVAKGQKVLPPALTDSLFSHVLGNAKKRGKNPSSNDVGLTKREREVVVLIAEGFSNKEIASRLNIATYTVKSHVHNILEKLDLRTRLQLASRNHNNLL